MELEAISIWTSLKTSSARVRFFKSSLKTRCPRVRFLSLSNCYYGICFASRPLPTSNFFGNTTMPLLRTTLPNLSSSAVLSRFRSSTISDTGLGSFLEEFQDLKCPVEGILGEKWDGIVSVRTTNIFDNEISCYQLNLKENVTIRKPIWLPSNIKHGVKFSGTEVCLSVSEAADVLLLEINWFFQKVLILNIPNMAMEVVVEGQDIPGSRNDGVFLENLPSSSSVTASTLDRLKLGLEDYVLRHGSSLMCDSCFPNRYNLRSGGGTVCEQKPKTTTLAVEAAIVISEILDPTNSCFGARSSDTEVFCFKNFAPCAISEAFLKTLTGIDWKRYGLALECAINQTSHALLKWKHVSLSFHIHIVVHCYHKLVAEGMPLVQKTQFDQKLIRKAVKFALDDLKNKYAGFLLSANTLKISRFAPDLAKTITGLVLSSNNLDFQEECLAILGLQTQQSEGEVVEANIKKKIISAIEVNDRRPQGRGTKEVGPLLFQDGRHQLLFVDDGCNEHGSDPMDL